MFDNVKKENRYISSNALFEKPAQSRTVDTHFTGEIMVHLKIYNLSIGTIGTIGTDTGDNKRLQKLS